MEVKNKSKLHKGFEKQVKRQNAKPEFVKVKISPIILSYSLQHGYRPLKKRFFNSKWNGMNLKQLYNSFFINRVGGMYGKFTIDSNGKYKLSIHGKSLLKKKRINKFKN